ncbi:non-ribosomal peptide synthetase [Paenibacillus assamensis]|uniref:non-ribosomal peptide synthetase n=1 Tax=Paenibacillus assamensis TaxID=311244 RepID=UPI00040C8DB8|nr:non-ribosomal peptide synthetase [Paenibacillus assamensis]
MASKVDIQKIYPLTPMQEGMLFHSIKDSNGAYVEQLIFEAVGSLNISYMEQSFNRLIERHEVLRTVFKYSKVERPIQIVLRERQGRIPYESIAELEEEAQMGIIEARKQRDRTDGFDLTRDIPMRITVLQTGPDRYRVIWSYHHIMMDGWCSSILFKDFLEFYRQCERGYESQLDPVYPYSAYVQWLERQDVEEAKSFWADYLEGIEEASHVPPQRVSSGCYEHGEFEYRLDKGLTAQLDRLGKERGITLSTVVQSIWGILLHRYNFTDDVAFGSVVSGRPPEVQGVEHIIGLFINTIPVRIRINRAEPVVHMMQQLHKDLQQAQQRAYVSLADIQSLSPLKQDLINHIVVFENVPGNGSSGDEEDDTALEKTLVDFETSDFEMKYQTNYDFNVIIHPGDELSVKFVYNAACYDYDFVYRMGGHFETVARQLANDPEMPIGNVILVSNEETEQLVQQFNHTTAAFPYEKVIQELFVEQVFLYSDKPALVEGEKTWTYRQLEEDSNRIAHLLRTRGVASNQLVGILAPRSAEMVIASLAVLKAGGAYLPIDPAYPEERVRYMLQDSGTPIVLVHSSLDRQQIADLYGREEPGYNIDIISLLAEDCSNHSHLPLVTINHPTNMAYVMYTSGSTGKPKGVMVGHRSVVRLVKNTNYAEFRPGGRILQTGAVAFDACTFEVWGALLNGMALYIVDEAVILNAHKLEQTIHSSGITTMWLTSPLFNQLSSFNPTMFRGMEQLIVGGDALSPVHVHRVMDCCPELTVINGYGPTENTTFSVCGRVCSDDRASIPIGYPISNSTAYVLAEGLQLQPIGITGELCVGGEGVALGYLNNPDLTREKFVEDPFRPGQMMYRTGDLAHWLPDGRLAYMGRMDKQVKIRGHRIETSEIVHHLLQHPVVCEAVVIVRKNEDVDNDLIAYFVASDQLSAAELRVFLKESLPTHMIPSGFINVERLPLNRNGKIDASLLPEPSEWLSHHAAYEEPQGETEIGLAAIWRELLRVESVGKNDDFFALGGHSLKITQLIARVQKEFQAELSVPAVFAAPQLHQMAQILHSASSAANHAGAILPANEKEYYAVSGAQRSLLSVQQYIGESHVYNIPIALLIRGKLDINRFRQALARIVDRHEAFRTSFHFMDQGPVQRIHSNGTIELEFRKIHFAADEEQVEDKLRELFVSFVQPFDVSRPPLLRVELVQWQEDRYLFMCDMHHVISDGTSLSIFMDELVALYKGMPLEPIKIGYKDYSEWQQGQIALEAYRRKRNYWLGALSGTLPRLELPTDYERPPVQDFRGARVDMVIGPELTEAANQAAAAHHTTLYMLLLTCLHVLLHRYTGQEDIIIGSPVAGRTNDDLASVIGMFVNTIVIRSHPSGGKAFDQLLKEVKNHTINALERQDYPFEELVKALKLPRRADRSPLIDVVFVLQNMDRGSRSINGLVIEPLSHDIGISKFDLTLQVLEHEGELHVSWEYAASLFKELTIETMHGDYIAILEQVCSDSNRKIGAVSLTGARSTGIINQTLTEDVLFQF